MLVLAYIRQCVWKALGEYKSSKTRSFGEYDFYFCEIISA